MKKKSSKLTVEKFKNEYESIQQESNDLQIELKGILARLKSLSKKAIKLSDDANYADDLYAKLPNGKEYANGWNISILHRLGDFACNYESIETIDTVLHNIKKTKFERKDKKQVSSKKTTTIETKNEVKEEA